MIGKLSSINLIGGIILFSTGPLFISVFFLNDLWVLFFEILCLGLDIFGDPFFLIVTRGKFFSVSLVT